jgi:1-acyl-sn-glycerol-3-phosphate acyltransferase
MRTLFLSFLYLVLMRIFLRLIIGVKYYNREALLKYDPVIIVSNHNSHLDTMALMSALSFSRIAKTMPVAAGDYFGKSKIKAFCTRLFVNALLIPREQKQGEANSIRQMTAMLDKKRSLIIFPEGTRGEPDKMQAFKRGIGLLLKIKKEIPYVPVFMKGLGTALPKGRFLLVPFESDIYIGEPRFAASDDVDGIVAEMEHNVHQLSEIYHQRLLNNELQ